MQAARLYIQKVMSHYTATITMLWEIKWSYEVGILNQQKDVSTNA